MSECAEPHRECLESLRLRVLRVINGNDWNTPLQELAEKANTSVHTIWKYRKEVLNAFNTENTVEPTAYDPGEDFEPVSDEDIDKWVEAWKSWPYPVKKQASAIISDLWRLERKRRRS
jgi:hypothetical protein